MKNQAIGFVGVGRMGANIARHLKLDCGYRIGGVYDANVEVAVGLATELGCSHMPKLSEITAASDVIITVVTDDDAMRGIYFNPNDNLLSGAKGKLFINCATVSPDVHIEVEGAAEDAGASALEAPMASSIPQARGGQLFLMVGGKKSVFEKARPLFGDMSQSLHYTGGAGTAAQVKALVNMVMNINTAGLAEGLGLADSLGLDLQMVKSIFSQTGANSRVLETDGDDMISRDHEVYFSAAHAAKDSGIALDLSRRVELNLPLAAATKEQYERMVREGLGEMDKSGIAELTFKRRRG